MIDTQMKNKKYSLSAVFLFSLLTLFSCVGESSSLPSSPTSQTSQSSSPAPSSPSTSTYPPFSYPDSVTIDEDPYADILTEADREAFYEDYEPASCYMDSYYRSLHHLMSGEIADQDQEPTLSEYQPMEDSLFVRNSSSYYSEDGNAYYVQDAHGSFAYAVYRGGAYITLEEVAAYVYAFHDVPANYDAGKNRKPKDSPWGIYLRVNNPRFSGDTSRDPYEPELPDILSGDLVYYEIDIGTTGTDCDPSYAVRPYNDGEMITRGAARIVYTRSKRGNEEIEDPDEGYVFYTYNHYNDFQEWLNYEGGWGEMFGNITGGGELSSKHDYNPTPYVETAREDF